MTQKGYAYNKLTQFAVIWVIILLSSLLSSSGASAHPLFQNAGQEYIVQADDSISKIAGKYYGDPQVWPVIREATNAKAKEDHSFAIIIDPDVIEIGQKLWLPSKDEAEQIWAKLSIEVMIPAIPVRKISDTEGNFTGEIKDNYVLSSVTSMGDLDGDDVADLAVGAPFDFKNLGVLFTSGTVWVLFLNKDGSVKSSQEISTNSGMTDLKGANIFGIDVASADLNGDSQAELIVGATGDGDGGLLRGAVWVLFLDKNGTVNSSKKISNNTEGFNVLNNLDVFGAPIANIGDLDGDGVPDLAVGATGDDDGGRDRGAIWILFMNKDGTVKSHQKISATSGNFTGVLDDEDNFGFSVDILGNLNSQGVIGLAVGAVRDDDGGRDRGAIWILFMNKDGTVKSHQKISATSGNFTGVLDDEDGFAANLTNLGDLDRDDVPDLAVGAIGDDDGGNNRGAVWILFMNNDGTVKSYRKISSTEGDFPLNLDNDDLFGFGLANLGDFDGDGRLELAVGAPYDDDGGNNRGAIWILSLAK